MTGDKVTRQHIRSDSNIDPVDYQALEAIKKENRAKSRREGKHIEEKLQAAVNIGKEPGTKFSQEKVLTYHPQGSWKR